MAEDRRAELKQWLASGQVSLHPLTFPQRELWEASPVAPADMANHICCLIRLRGSITARASERAVRRVVERQEVLRLSFLPGKERPMQMIRQSLEPNFRFRELSAAEARDEAIDALAAETFSARFDLLKGPLYRIEVLKRGPEDFVLIFAIHHAIADGWTLGVFVEELCVAYAQELLGLRDPLPGVALTYSAWGAAERARWTTVELEQRLAYWKPLLQNRPRLWDSSEGPLTAAGSHERWVTGLGVDLRGAIEERARQDGATLYSTLLTAFQIALARWTGRTDLMVGTPVANRSIQGVKETMGYCAGVVPIRMEVDRQRPFRESLQIVHALTVDAFAHAMPFAELAAALGDPGAPGHHPIYEVRFALQNHPVPEVSLSGLSAKLSMRSTGTARFHLGCEITVIDEGLEVVWLYRPQVISESEVSELASLFESVLTGACAAPEKRSALLA